MAAMGDVRKLWVSCKVSGNSFIGTAARHLVQRFAGRNILVGDNVSFQGAEFVQSKHQLQIAIGRFGFMSRKDETIVKLGGPVVLTGKFLIGRGCRVETGANAKVSLGASYVNPQTLIIIAHGLHVGDGCAISWKCQILDDDFHDVVIDGIPSIRGAPIYIGSNVWIGSGVTILKGSHIPDGCIVAAGAVVRSAFTEKNALIAGNPAKVIRSGVRWSSR